MTKKIISLLLAVVMTVALAACGQTQKTEPKASTVADTQPDSRSGSDEAPKQSVPETPILSEAETTASVDTTDTNGKTLIVYFSWSASGNTEKMAA